MDKIISEILDEMSEILSVGQQKKLQQVLIKKLAENRQMPKTVTNSDYEKLFLDAKKVEGCSERTLAYYRTTLDRFFCTITDSARKITTEQIRGYLADYQKINNCSNVTVDNIRRNISSFFSWMEEEDHIFAQKDEKFIKLINRIRDIKVSRKDLLYEQGIRTYNRK